MCRWRDVISGSSASISPIQNLSSQNQHKIASTGKQIVMVWRPEVLSQSLPSFRYRLSFVYQKSLNVPEQTCNVYWSKVWIQLTPKLMCAMYSTAMPLIGAVKMSCGPSFFPFTNKDWLIRLCGCGCVCVCGCVCMSVLGTITHSLRICHLAIKLYFCCSKNSAREFWSKLNSTLWPVNIIVLLRYIQRLPVNKRESVPETWQRLR